MKGGGGPVWGITHKLKDFFIMAINGSVVHNVQPEPHYFG
jgi:hypothetical protein